MYGEKFFNTQSTQTGIELQLCSGTEPYIELVDFHPNNQTSGKMIRSLVVQITDSYGAMFGKRMYTKLEDRSCKLGFIKPQSAVAVGSVNRDT